LSSSEPSPGGVAAALARAARAQPEAPFLFYRNARGDFRWWSFSTAVAFFDGGGLRDESLSVKGVVVEREAVELLGGFLRAATGEGSDVAGGARIPAPEPKVGRDVWISWRALSTPEELSLARWAIASGAAILVEPGTAIHPELFAWARPTVVSGSVEDLLGLAGQLAVLAPRFLRRRWLRQRAERLRLVIVSGSTATGDLARVEACWRDLSPLFAPRVVALVESSLV